jgi:hypothetical protein
VRRAWIEKKKKKKNEEKKKVRRAVVLKKVLCLDREKKKKKMKKKKSSKSGGPEKNFVMGIKKANGNKKTSSLNLMDYSKKKKKIMDLPRSTKCTPIPQPSKEESHRSVFPLSLDGYF